MAEEVRELWGEIAAGDTGPGEIRRLGRRDFRDPRSVSVLLNVLGSEPRGTFVVAAAKSLGAIGDLRAVVPLLRSLFKPFEGIGSGDTAGNWVRVAIAKALARITLPLTEEYFLTERKHHRRDTRSRVESWLEVYSARKTGIANPLDGLSSWALGYRVPIVDRALKVVD
ncbi:MAG: hypothetical protein JKY65_30555 [Planctomycetes bacterium]|nr:hypothetical protein [Planctomycetota bacterium]